MRKFGRRRFLVTAGTFLAALPLIGAGFGKLVERRSEYVAGIDMGVLGGDMTSIVVYEYTRGYDGSVCSYDRFTGRSVWTQLDKKVYLGAASSFEA